MCALKFFLGLLAVSTVTSKSLSSLFTTKKPVFYDLNDSTEGRETNGDARSTTLANKPVASERTGCGWRQTDGVSFRITDTDEAAFGEFPWVVAIFVYNKTTSKSEYWCAGSLITPTVVLSGGRLREVPPQLLRVRAGDWDLSAENELLSHQTAEVARVFVHPRFNSSTLAYDASLLFLRSAMSLAPNVGLACLGRKRPAAGARCVVAGWGSHSDNGSAQNILKMVEVPIVEQTACQSKLREALKFPLILQPSALCAGGEPGKDACKRDGGAPLMCPYENQPGRYYQVGIVSWGVGCGRAGVPAVYTDLAALRPWPVIPLDVTT